MENTLKVVLTSKQQVAPSIATFTFRRQDGAPFPTWKAGAHVSVLLADGTSRCYSLCGPSDVTDTWTVAVLREPEGRGGSLKMHDKLAEGDIVELSAPRNNFALEPAQDYLFIAGGIGITPLVPMIEEARHRGATWRLLYLVRARNAAIFLDQLEGTGGTVDVWVSDEQGFYPLDDLHDLVTADTGIYACGPPLLLSELEGRWPEGQFHMERFTGNEEDPSEEADAFDVVLAQSGTTVRVEPGVSVLEAIEAAAPSVAILQSCREGVCGSCETPVLEGIPDHRDLVLTKREKEKCDRMMLCVSRAQSQRLVLDL